KVIHQDAFETIKYIPDASVDLIITDPPYNMAKTFNKSKFKKRSDGDYEDWLNIWIPELARILKDDGSIYICSEWQSSYAIHKVMNEHFIVRNRITWEREKGRGAKTNWKNNSEDIWFATKSDDYVFNVDAVKLKRRVIAPYRNDKGEAKDWDETEDGKFRLTFPSNLWTDISVPFWSMPENTEHPTQKPEKLVAKLILASSNEGQLVFDPFLGSGTTAVVAKKLKRNITAIELDERFACISLKRLKQAEENSKIQGFENGEFLERNHKLLR
ncbi:MAG: site-specific DNA-methyltransferase, partial [Lentisphaeria bacterium]|nr:site-specific DNA-methyltransferase [Lentisphaeria bacterium]